MNSHGFYLLSEERLDSGGEGVWRFESEKGELGRIILWDTYPSEIYSIEY